MIIATSTPNRWKIGAELIKFYQKTKFSHILIIKDDLVFQASQGYVNCMHIDIFNANNKIIHRYEVDDGHIDFDFVKKQLGKKYSKIQIFNIATRFLLGIRIFKNNKDQQFICSEYVGKALKLDWVNDNTSPKEIYEFLNNNNS